MFKKISLGILIFVGLIFLVGLVLPSTYHVERSILIESPPEKVYPYLKDFKAWESWSVWAKLDPKQTVRVDGEPGKPGHVQEWNGPINGKGSMTIDQASENSFVSMKLKFEEPQAMVATSKLELQQVDGKTKVTWHNEGGLDYPIGRFFGLFLDSLLGKDFEAGLQSLKELVEKQP